MQRLTALHCSLQLHPLNLSIMDNTNNLSFIYAELNTALYSHIRRISVTGKPDTFEGKLTKRIIDLNAHISSIMEDLHKEINKDEAAAETAFFKSHPELNP